MATSGQLLAVDSAEVSYGPIRALYGVTLNVEPGEIVAIVGPNGAGKSTLLNAIVGLRPLTRGRITWRGRDITGLAPQQRVRLGIGLVPEHRRILTTLTVEENLLVSATALPGRLRRVRANELMERFEVLGENRSRRAGLLSGGQEQLLAIARALMGSPELLLLDEPTLGLAPIVAAKVFGIIDELHQNGTTLIVVEQNIRRVLESADSACIMRTGRIVERQQAERLAARTDLFDSFLGDLLPTEEGCPQRPVPSPGADGTCLHTERSASCD
ncbi:MAG: ABC transporter ATP-binding protein [Acidimicrobiaceae bacterium]|nr:ABC transporter ATP-binding protein [Acidimicrobiaceae bacterium]MDE0607634.1 ABC transporter ATP-binding protein [Acidimicrobiaceae bacterium]